MLQDLFTYWTQLCQPSDHLSSLQNNLGLPESVPKDRWPVPCPSHAPERGHPGQCEAHLPDVPAEKFFSEGLWTTV